MENEIKVKVSKSRQIVEKIMYYLDWAIGIAIGFFLREIMVRWGLWKSCPLISECQRCFTYGGLLG